MSTGFKGLAKKAARLSGLSEEESDNEFYTRYEDVKEFLDHFDLKQKKNLLSMRWD